MNTVLRGYGKSANSLKTAIEFAKVSMLLTKSA